MLAFSNVHLMKKIYIICDNELYVINKEEFTN